MVLPGFPRKPVLFVSELLAEHRRLIGTRKGNMLAGRPLLAVPESTISGTGTTARGARPGQPVPETSPRTADELKTTALAQLHDHYDRSRLGMILIDMPGIEKRLARSYIR